MQSMKDVLWQETTQIIQLFIFLLATKVIEFPTKAGCIGTHFINAHCFLDTTVTV